MEISTCKNYDFSNLTLEKPNKVEDVYVSKLNIVIQTPKLKVFTVSNNKITILLDEDTNNLISDFDDKIINLLSENSKNFFEDELSVEEAEDMYKCSLKENKSKKQFRMTLNISPKLSIYNKHKEKLRIDNLSKDDEVICLLKCSKIIYYKRYCMAYWEILQIKVKEYEMKFDTYSFIEDKNDTYEEIEQEDISSIKSLTIKD
jgi:hypothetical protein